MLIPERQFLMDRQVLLDTLHYIHQINQYLVQNIQLKGEMERNKGHRRQSFLQKFQGRKNAVGKEGVLLLLQHQIQDTTSKEKVIQSNLHKNLQKIKIHSVPTKINNLKSKERESQSTLVAETPKPARRQNSPLQKQLSSTKKLPVINEYRARKRQARSQQLVGGRQKLPSIYKRSSLSRSSQRLSTEVSKINKGGKLQKSESFPKKTGRIQILSQRIMQEMLILDNQALGHLQSLNQFQKLIMKQKIQTNKGESVLQLN